MNYQEKYLKYKVKYMQLKSMSGGGSKNAVIFGCGPLGLITALVILNKNNRYRKMVEDVKELYMIERSEFWRPQIFFLQNSWTYDTLDFIREIDPVAYKAIEKIGCYVGTPASMKRPYCYRYKSTSLSSKQPGADSPQAPLRWDGEREFEKGDFVMNNLAFRIKDIETVLFERIANLASTSDIKVHFFTPQDRYNEIRSMFNFVSEEQVNAAQGMPIGTTSWKILNENGTIVFKNNLSEPLPTIKSSVDSSGTNISIDILNKDNYDIVFSTDGQYSQFNDSDDRSWALVNRNDILLDDENSVDIECSPLLYYQLKANDIIDIGGRKYVVTDKMADGFELYRLKQGTNPYNASKFTELYGDRIKLPNHINSVFSYQIEVLTTKFKLTVPTNQVSTNSVPSEGPLCVVHMVQLVTIDAGSKTETQNPVLSIKKYNNLVFKEENCKLRECEPAIYANVLFYRAIGVSKDKHSYTIVDKEIPYGYDIADNLMRTNKSIYSRSRRGPLTQQVYMNNDQAQYFNNSLFAIGDREKNLAGALDTIHISSYSPNPQHSFRVFGTPTDISGEEIIKDLEESIKMSPEGKSRLKNSFNDPSYYVGFLVSTELGKLYENVKGDNKKAEVIFRLLWLFGKAYSTDVIVKFDSVVDTYRSLDVVYKEFNETYGIAKVDAIKEGKTIFRELLNIFGISLKYRDEYVRKEDGKTIVFVGDSGATVNFFSGTGVNNGVANLKYILEHHNDDLPAINKYLEKKNRKTIYNSLLTSQNSSHMGPKKSFNVDGKEVGCFAKYSSTIGTVEQLRDLYIGDDGDKIGNTFIKMLSTAGNFRTLFNYIIEKTGADFGSSTDDVFKILYGELLHLVYNMFIVNPILGSVDSDAPGNYLMNMDNNYIDFCAHNRPESNEDYDCVPGVLYGTSKATATYST